jgi:hypothetical protein
MRGYVPVNATALVAVDAMASSCSEVLMVGGCGRSRWREDGRTELTTKSDL